MSSGERKPHSWSSGDAYLWARKQEGANANPPNRPGKGDGLLGDTPSPPNQGQQFPIPNAGPPPLHPNSRSRNVRGEASERVLGLQEGARRLRAGSARQMSAANPAAERPAAAASHDFAALPSRTATPPASAARAGAPTIAGNPRIEPEERGRQEALERQWTVWKDTAKSRVLSSQDFDFEHSERRDISTWEDFYSFWTDLEGGSTELGEGCNVRLFVRGVKPTWEQTQAHGKWVILTDKKETLWRLHLVVQAVLEGRFGSFRHLCGVELSIRPTRDCIAIWNTRGGDSGFIKSTRTQLITAARLGPSHKVNYLIIRAGPAGAGGGGGGAPLTEKALAAKQSGGEAAADGEAVEDGDWDMSWLASEKAGAGGGGGRGGDGDTASTTSSAATAAAGWLSLHEDGGHDGGGESWNPYLGGGVGGLGGHGRLRQGSPGRGGGRGSSTERDESTWPPPQGKGFEAAYSPLIAVPGGASIWGPVNARSLEAEEDATGHVERGVEMLLCSDEEEEGAGAGAREQKEGRAGKEGRGSPAASPASAGGKEAMARVAGKASSLSPFPRNPSHKSSSNSSTLSLSSPSPGPSRSCMSVQSSLSPEARPFVPGQGQSNSVDVGAVAGKIGGRGGRRRVKVEDVAALQRRLGGGGGGGGGEEGGREQGREGSFSSRGSSGSGKKEGRAGRFEKQRQRLKELQNQLEQLWDARERGDKAAEKAKGGEVAKGGGKEEAAAAAAGGEVKGYEGEGDADESEGEGEGRGSKGGRGGQEGAQQWWVLGGEAEGERGEGEEGDEARDEIEEAMMGGEGVRGAGGREMSRELRMKVAMRSLVGRERLRMEERGSGRGKRGRGKGDKRSDPSSTEGEGTREEEAAVREGGGEAREQPAAGATGAKSDAKGGQSGGMQRLRDKCSWIWMAGGAAVTGFVGGGLLLGAWTGGEGTGTLALY